MTATCLPQRTGNQADSRKQPFRSRQRADRYTNKWVAIRLASIQFRRTLPAPSHLSTTISTTYDNPRDGAPEWTSPYRTGSQATPGQSLQFSTRELCLASTIENPLEVRASNSRELLPCHHIRPRRAVSFSPVFPHHRVCRTPTAVQHLSNATSFNRGSPLQVGSIILSKGSIPQKRFVIIT